MIRTVQLTPPPGDWIAYQIDERTDTGWNTVAARPVTETGVFSAAAAFSPDAEEFRVVWVGEGGSKNMRIGPAEALQDAAPVRVVGGLRVT